MWRKEGRSARFRVVEENRYWHQMAPKWSEGRPGWHTECCVMIDSIFRAQNGYIDIHGGGFDLKFPHHENEMAQAKAHNGNKLARYWVHNGFINVNNEKMSKSLGNVILMKDVVKEYGGIPFRLMLLASALSGAGFLQRRHDQRSPSQIQSA
jgi:cysteinyl-tRNA synthetase